VVIGVAEAPLQQSAGRAGTTGGRNCWAWTTATVDIIIATLTKRAKRTKCRRGVVALRSLTMVWLDSVTVVSCVCVRWR
jgi:hypothetical protein